MVILSVLSVWQKTRPKIFLVVFLILWVTSIFSVISLGNKYNEELHKDCPFKGEACPFKHSYPFESYGSITAIILLGVFSLSLILKTRISEINKFNKISKNIQLLQRDEQTIYKIIIDSEGMIMQSKLVEISGFPKSKVTRIIDRLEFKGFIERRRRGIGNLIVVKTETSSKPKI